MSNPKIGWDVDYADAGAAAGTPAGDNHVIKRFTDIETLRVAGTTIPLEQWESAVGRLSEWMLCQGPEGFLDGPHGKYFASLAGVLGIADPNTIPHVSFAIIVSGNRTVGNGETFTVQASVPAGVNVASVAWTISGDGGVTITADADKFTATLASHASTTGTNTVTCTVTDKNGDTSADQLTITVA